MNKDRFYHTATLDMLQHLELESALRALLRALIQIIPVFRIYYLNQSSSDSKIGSLAYVTENGSTQKQPSVEHMPLPNRLPKEIKAGESGKLRINTKPDSLPLLKLFFESTGDKAESVIFLNLTFAKNSSVTLIFSSGTQKFEKKDVDWIELLKQPIEMALSNIWIHQEAKRLKDQISNDNVFMREELGHGRPVSIIGEKFGLGQVMENARKVSQSDSPVLLLGETGVGKSLVARGIHEMSLRRDGPFIEVNCGAIPENLLESELFGHEKGAFTGAVSLKPGKLERANGGTILLDEIGELPLAFQASLLRVLQNNEIERVGGSEKLRFDLRILAATNRNLEQMVAEGGFREDLYFRINVFPIKILPLRDRKEDLSAMIQHFLAKKAEEMKIPKLPRITENALDRARSYHWPGNVRELQNIIERALILNPRGPIDFKGLLPEMTASKTSDSNTKTLPSLDEFNAQYLRHVLKHVKGKIFGKNGAAELLQIKSGTLRNRMDKLGVSYRKQESQP